MHNVNLLRPRSGAMSYRRGFLAICAAMLLLLGGFGLLHKRAEVRALVAQQQQQESAKQVQQQQLVRQQAALAQRRAIVRQQLGVINVLRGIGISKSAVGRYTKVRLATEGWNLQGVAANHDDVAQMVLKLQAAAPGYSFAVAKVSATGAASSTVPLTSRVTYEIRSRPLDQVNKAELG